jgi:hypothetical protein
MPERQNAAFRLSAKKERLVKAGLPALEKANPFLVRSSPNWRTNPDHYALLASALRKIYKEAPAKKPKERIIVHLGNVGYMSIDELPAEKTLRVLKGVGKLESLKGTKVVGIDENSLKHFVFPNWKQIRADFVGGLSQLEDSSVSLISSEMALGYFGRMLDTPSEADISIETIRGRLPKIEYTRSVLDLSFRKLCAEGKLVLVVGESAMPHLRTAFQDSPFSQAKIEIRELSEKEMGMTYWTRKGKGSGKRFFEITAKK